MYLFHFISFNFLLRFSYLKESEFIKTVSPGCVIRMSYKLSNNLHIDINSIFHILEWVMTQFSRIKNVQSEFLSMKQRLILLF